MNFRFRLNRAHLAAVMGAVLAIGVGLFLHDFRFGAKLVRSSQDLLNVARGQTKVDEVVIVYLDEASHAELHQPLNAPWDRAIHAKLVDRLTAAGARAVVFDIVFGDVNSNNPAGDEAFAAAVKRNGHVVLAADNYPVGQTIQTIAPFPLLLDSAADIGSDVFDPDDDTVVRQHTPRGNNPISSMSWATAALVKAPITLKEGAEYLPRWINYYGQPAFVPWKSYYEALNPTLVADDFFHGKVVYVGARIMTKFAGDRKDEYKNPFSYWLNASTREENRALYSPGVEVQATTFLNLLRGDWFRRASFGVERLLIIGFGLVFGWGLVRFHPVWATTIALAGLAVVAGGSYGFLSKKLIWFPWLILVVQMAFALAWSILFNSIQLYVEKRLYERMLRLYLPPKLVRKFAKTREFLKPGAQTQTLTLLFSDIAGFTSMSEGMNGNELAGLMNAYFEVAVAKCIHKADGTVSKFIGDAIFAFWNAPDAQQNHAQLACEAALLFRQQATQPIQGRLLPTRIGLHTGEANVGNFGSEQRVDYTALGENVNLASRLEGLNKYLGTFCVMSGTTRAAIGDKIIVRPLGSFQLKGFEGLVDVFELVDLPEQAAASRDWREAFAEALNNYEQRNLEFAELGFRRVLELKAGDGPSNFYLQRIAEMAKEALPENWATYTILKEK